jgi:CBS domain containing-hemolysin-like protein
MTLQLFAVAVLLAVNALYVAAEFAAISARRTRIRQLAEAGNARARCMRSIQDDASSLDRYVACCQVGITLSSLVLGAYGQIAFTPALADLLERAWGLDEGSSLGTAATAVLLTLTSLQVVLAELVPKSVALQYPVQVALSVAFPMRWSLLALRPFIALLNGSGLALLRLIGRREPAHRHIHSPDEIALLIAESREGGMLREEEHERLERALRLSVHPVRRLMVPRRDIVAVEANTPLGEVLARLAGTPLTRLPVYERTLDQIVGLVHARDVARRVLEPGGEELRGRDVMRHVAFVPESIRAERLVAELRRQRSELAIVMDEHGGVAGMVTLDDVLAEVLGEGPAANGAHGEPEQLPDGRLRIAGRMRVDEAHEWLGVLWEGEATPSAGWSPSISATFLRPASAS